LREIGVAPQQHFAKTAPKTSGRGAIEGVGGLLVRRAIARPIDEPHDLARVGQTDDQGMIAPRAIVSDADAFFALGIGLDERAVGVEDGEVEEIGGLLFPHPDTNIVVNILKRVDVFRREAPTEITSGGGIRNALGAESIKEVDVLAAQFDVLQTVAVAQSVIGDIEYMIGFVIGEMNLEQVQFAIDGVDESNASSQQVKRADAAVRDAVNAVGNFVVNVAGREDGPIAATGFAFVKPALKTALASVELSSYLDVHSKFLSCAC